MMPMEPTPEDLTRQLEDRRRQMLEARALVYLVHSRTGLLRRILRDLAEAVDPTGRQRENLR
jgi:hypothetical protein